MFQQLRRPTWLTRRTRRMFWLAVFAAMLSLSVSALLARPLPVFAVSRVSAASLSLSPTSGPPGTVVTLRGDVPDVATAPPAYAGVTVCLDGCATGFTETDVPFRWLGRGRFTAVFTIPRVPVLTAEGPLVLQDGRYRIGFTCFGPGSPGCAARTEAGAIFTVTGAKSATCTGEVPCATLRLSPARAEPGQLVTVRGYAPLSPVIGQPFGYELVLREGRVSAVLAQMGQVHQGMTGGISGGFRMPALLPGLGVVQAGRVEVFLRYPFNQVAQRVGHLPPGVTIERRGEVIPGTTFGYELVSLAPTPFQVLPLPTWASMGRLVPKASQWSMPLPLAGRPGGTREFAYCVPGGIRVTTDGGRSWTRIATEGAAVTSMAGPFPIAYNLKAPMPDVTCTSLLWDPNDPHTFYASFDAINRSYASAPPVYSVLWETRDNGRTWHFVPVPKGYTQGDFGGMGVVPVRQGYGVEAVFGQTGNAPPAFDGMGSAAATAEVTVDGGDSWRTTGLTCPPAGPCLRFGAMPGMLPGMGAADLQPLVTSRDGGRSWQALAWPEGNVLAQGFPYSGQSQLVWLGGKQLAFVDASSQYPLRLSKDGGRTWQAVALPLPPRTETSVPVREGSSPYAVLMLLPNGDLLAATAGTTEFGALWWLLRPRASRWTADAAITAPAVLGRLLAVGSRLYWLKVSSGGPQGILFTGVGSAPLPSSDPVRGHARARPEVTLLSIGAEGPSRQLVTLRGHGFGQKAGELLLLVAHGRPERLAIRSWHETEVTAVVPLRKETLLGEMARGARLLLRTADGARLTVPLRPKFQGDGRGRLRASRPFDR